MSEYWEEIEEIPKAKKERGSLYEDIIKSFIDADTEKIRIIPQKLKEKGIDADAKSIGSALSKILHDMKAHASVSVRGKDVFLRKLTDEEYKEKLKKGMELSRKLKGVKRKKK